MKAKIFVRQKINWELLTREDFHKQSVNSPVHKINNSQKDILSIWDTLFNIDFISFRKRMKAIAHDQNELTGLSIIEGEEELKQEMNNDEDIYILPTDDDDFFNPNILEFLAKSKSNIVLWPEGWMWGSKLFQARPPTKGTGTNTYAIKKSFLKTLDEQQCYKILRYHGSVCSTLYPNTTITDFIKSKCDFINHPLSISNRHIGTITLWQNLILNNEKIELKIIERFKEYTKNKIKISNNYEWAKDTLIKNLKHHNLLFSTKIFKFSERDTEWEKNFILH
jgi:hypothetical protein